MRLNIKKISWDKGKGNHLRFNIGIFELKVN